MIVLLFIFSKSYYGYTSVSITEMTSMKACIEAEQVIKDKKFFLGPQTLCKEVKR